MNMLKSRPFTWCVLKQALHNVNQLRFLSATSLYEKNGKWSPYVKFQELLEIEDIWKSRLHEYDDKQSKKQTEKGREKFYVLSMFPYPSGKLHMGHVRVYTISDMMARYHRMLGHQVIHPMGFDAFGLPAENAAIERNLHPKQWTYSNIATMKEQLKNLCFAFDWDREVITCDPSYYKWTQYIFLKMYDQGLVYQTEASVNWDPVDETVLADEQIDDEGRSWRSGAIVEKLYLRQWYIKTTAYAKSLLDGIDTVRSDLWKDVVQLQRHWIGQCTGCRFNFKIKVGNEEESLSVFTDTPAAVYGISHIALAPTHRYNKSCYHKHTNNTSTSEIELNLEAIHPVTGEVLPVVVSEMSTVNMGTNDTHIGIPSVSEIDRSVADVHGLPWQHVFSTNADDAVLINSHQLNGLSKQEATDEVMKIAREGGFGGHPVSSHLRDWLISRQRYWGTPIPMVHCDKCKAVPVPYESLPVELPDSAATSVAKGRAALLDNHDWLNVKCPKCGGDAKRETDTMDTFVDSSWYFLRYLDVHNTTEPVARQQAETYMPVDLYIGGLEHAHLHLYYARFFNHFLCDVGMTTHREPFVNLLTQGMVKGESFKVARTGIYLQPSDVEKQGNKYVQKSTGEKVICKYEKMSKSKHNGVDPEDLLAQYGADLTRLCILSNVSPKSERNWNNEVYVGAQKFLNRVWCLVGVLVNQSTPQSTVSHDQSTPQSTVSHDQLDQWEKTIKEFRNKYFLEIRYHLNRSFLINTAISRMHEITNDLKKVPKDVALQSKQYERTVKDLVIMLAAFTPMFSMECWTGLHRAGYAAEGNVLEQQWPEVDDDAVYWLHVLCNQKYVGRVPLNYTNYKQLNPENVIKCVQNEDFWSELTQNHNYDVARVNLGFQEDWNASVTLSVPGLVVEDKSENKEKKPKGKKAKKGKKDKQKETETIQQEG